MECGPVILSFLGEDEGCDTCSVDLLSCHSWGKMKVVIHEVWTCYPVIPGGR